MTATRRRKPKTSRRTTPPSAHGPFPVPVRLTRVRAALQRIATGYYDRDDVRDRLASAVLKELKSF